MTTWLLPLFSHPTQKASLPANFEGDGHMYSQEQGHVQPIAPPPPPSNTHTPKRHPCLQFVKRMGVRTHKSMVMCRPSQIEVAVEPPPSLRGNPSQGQPYSPATVLERKDVGDVMKYWVKFDDGQVRSSAPPPTLPSPSPQPCPPFWQKVMNERVIFDDEQVRSSFSPLQIIYP